MSILHVRINLNSETTTTDTTGWDHYAYDFSILGDQSWERHDGIVRVGTARSRKTEDLHKSILESTAYHLDLIESIRDEYGTLNLYNTVDYLDSELDVRGADGLKAAHALIDLNEWITKITPDELDTLRAMKED